MSSGLADVSCSLLSESVRSYVKGVGCMMHNCSFQNSVLYFILVCWHTVVG